MLKLVLIALLLVHGLIHVMGFAKAFGLAEIEQLSRPISRAWGTAWGVCAVLVFGAMVARIGDASWWWMLGAPAVIFSQVLIIAFWSDAKAGTLANVLLLAPVLVAFGSWQFAQRAEAEVDQLAARASAVEAATVVEASELAALPKPVARWLERARVVGRGRDRTVRLTQRGALQSGPEGDWMSFRAEQYILVDEPAFLWVARVKGGLGIHMAGRDRFIDGKGSMRIELLSLIPVVNADGPTIDQGAAVRFLAEMMWYPSAALEPYIRWEGIDERSARATLRYKGVEVSGLFHFAENGDPIRFEARRYRDSTLLDWVIENNPVSFRKLDGVRIPTQSTITWKEPGKPPWTWLRLQVVSLDRNGRLTH
jgi:hypothetical protein